MKSRGTPTAEKPFIWASKRSLERIRDCPQVTEFGTALAVYTALVWIASDHGKDVFTIEQTLIARQSGFSVRTVQRFLPELEAAGVVHIERPEVRSQHTYTLLPFNTTPVRNDATPRRNDTTPMKRIRVVSTKIGNKPNKPNRENPVGEESETVKHVLQKPFEEMTGEERGKYFRRLQTEAHAREWEASSNE